MVTFADRVKISRKATGLTQAEVAKRIGISRAALAQWENGKTKSINSEHLHIAARILKTHPEWLATGTQVQQNAVSSTMVPIAPWQDLEHWLQDKRYDHCIEAINPPPNSYALQVRDDSMQCTSGRSFPVDYWLIISQTTEAENNRYVIVSQDGIVKFRWITEEGTLLKPLNPQWPVDQFTGSILGIVVQCYFPDIYSSN